MTRTPSHRTTLAVLLSVLVLVSTASATVGATGMPTGGASPLEADETPSLSSDRPRDDRSAVTNLTRQLAQIEPQAAGSFRQETVFSGLSQPMDVAFLPDGRALVITKTGRVVVGNPSNGQYQTYMQLPNVDTARERGLESIALDPNFAQNKYVYLYYVRASNPHRARVSRFTHQENQGGLSSRGAVGSERVVWQDNADPKNCCHFGGGMGFGPDGKLYLTTGEEFDPTQSQDLSQSGGKIIRVNKDGTVPTDNPFAGDGKASTLDTIWAYGLRNPFRASWDRQTGRFYIGDVGGNDDRVAQEEVNVGKKGANYGWPYCEGPCSRAGTTNPVFSYPHAGGEAAITGGFVYRGAQFPSAYQGAYFYGDYARDWIRYLKFDSNGKVTGSYSFSTGTESIVDLSQGPEGGLYWVSISQGRVSRFVYQSAGSEAPTITRATGQPTSGPAPLTVQFAGSATDPNGDRLTYRWVFGDGTSASGASVSHTYQKKGRYTAYLRVSDGTTTVDSGPVVVSVGSGPDARITAPAGGTTFRAGQTISLRGTGTDPEDGTLSGNALTWNVEFVHSDHTHPVITDAVGGSASFQVPTTGHDYHGSTAYRISLTARDSDGLTDTETVTVAPEKVDLTLRTQPAGLTVNLDSAPRTTPLVYDTLVGFRHAVEAPATQCVAGTQYQFQRWSDGGARAHTVTVPTSATTLTATYATAGSCTGGSTGAIPTNGLALRLESDGITTRSGGIVTGWADTSGRGNALTAGGDPTLAKSPSGQNVVAFDGNGDLLQRTSLTAFPTGNTDRTVVMVGRYDSPGFGGFAYGSASCNRAFGTVVDKSGKLALQGWCSGNDFSSAAGGTGAGWLVQSATLRSGTYTHFKNGRQIGTGSHTYATTGNSLVLGAELSPGPYLDMDVAAVVVYNRALSDTERKQVESYLRQKYLGGTAASVTTAGIAVDSAGLDRSRDRSDTGDNSPTFEASAASVARGDR
ncbi:PQQ-dependent sugar dehydrogenase [Halogeometricum limi]|uniref:Glucose/arabinose dehydrogenase, beta-propeller fold n=1 Tax=Halogeometricum limi TaxID=555875 RepID=A0A1I6G4L4_9EURY|nr:PQQ-dependent sugar dehydrogenase [Halogeometricum limi]SFR37153.1 Glucose/arabinose dehydrogenase, beta-propeller fold [Halogeometricum limi]